MAAPATEERELQLVESVEFRILGVANKEDKLHQLLQRYLAPLILKAASDHASVRARVCSVICYQLVGTVSHVDRNIGYPDPCQAQDVYSTTTVCETSPDPLII